MVGSPLIHWLADASNVTVTLGALLWSVYEPDARSIIVVPCGDVKYMYFSPAFASPVHGL